MASNNNNKKGPQSNFVKWAIGILSTLIVLLGGVGVLNDSTGEGAVATILNILDSVLYGGSTKAPPSLPASGETKVHVLDVGQGESILVTTKEKTLLIDAGENDKGDEILDFLKELGVTKLDYVLATHPHADHIGGMDFVLENMPAGKVLFGEVPASILPTTKTYRDLLGVIKTKKIPLETVSPGDTYDLGSGAVLTILGPLSEQEDLNDCSVVSRLDFGSTSFLFSGDQEAPAEKELLAAGVNLDADVMTMGHHGSSTSSSDAYFNAISPTFSAISCGKGNKYGHPHRETVAKLDKSGIEYYRTDIGGCISFTSTGKKIKVQTQKP